MADQSKVFLTTTKEILVADDLVYTPKSWPNQWIKQLALIHLDFWKAMRINIPLTEAEKVLKIASQKWKNGFSSLVGSKVLVTTQFSPL